MSPQEFSSWMDRMWLDEKEAARELGISTRRVRQYEADGAPHYIALACSALARKLPPWPQKHEMLQRRSLDQNAPPAAAGGAPDVCYVA